MKVLLISSDKKILEEGSVVRARMIEYGSLFEKLEIVVFSKRKFQNENPKSKIKISQNVFVYETNSISKWMYVFDAIKIGKRIIGNWDVGFGNSVVTAQDPFECGFVGWKLSQKFGLPLHLQIHTDFLSSHFKTSILQTVRVWLATFLLPKASGVRVVSQRIADSIVKAHIELKHPPYILPIRIDIESIDASAKTDLRALFPHFTFLILMASRLTREKRMTDALFVLQKIIAQYPSVGLLIAGDGREKKNLEKMSLHMGISENIVFLGFRTDIPSLMKSADIFLSTSEYEGYGMSVIEAGLCHCPVVSTDVGVASEVIKDGLNGFLCPVGGRECLYSKITRLISDNSLREIVAGRLNSDIRARIPTKEEYVKEWVKGLQDTISN